MFRIRRITATSTYLKNYFLQTRGAEPPAFDDVDCYLACDSTALYVGELDEKPVGVVGVFKYEDSYRHCGGFYIEEKYRHYGYAFQLSNYVFNRAEPMSNLSAYAQSVNIEKYKKYYGWKEILYTVEIHRINSVTASKNLQALSKDSSCNIKEVSDVDFEDIFQYDKCTFGYDRKQFLYKWLYSPASHSFVALNNEGSIVGYIVARKAMAPKAKGDYVIRPLYCEDINIGKDLLQSVLEHINKQDSPSLVQSCFPMNQDPRVRELLNILNGDYVESVVLMARNVNRKGRIDKWFSPTSYICG